MSLEFRETENIVGMKKSEQICREFSLDEIKTATRNFDEKLIIGKGGFGFVFKGSINNGAELAIKRLSFESNQGKTEFLREIATLSELRHKHLVRLKGYCNQSSEMILVYEYMPNGTLVNHLYKIKDLGSPSGDGQNQQYALTWEQRLNICIGAARGVDFLHRECVPGIIHRDIKDSNILLDENFVAKIADFGLAKLVKTSSDSQSTNVSSTGVKGTFGYLDPEYFYTQRLSKKTDVYAFGVLLLVVLCGRPAVSNKATEDQRGLAQWAQNCIQKNRVDVIIDPNLAGKISSKSLRQFLKISEKCLRRQSEQRPTMEEVVLGLELALKKQASLYGSTSNQSNGWSNLTQMVTKLQTEWTKKQSAIAVKEKLVSLASVTQSLSPKLPLEKIKNTTQNFGKEKLVAQPTVARISLELDFELRQFKTATQDMIERLITKTGGFGMVKTRNLSEVEINGIKFSFDEMKTSTQNFSEKLIIGQGGFGMVYKGRLNDGLEVAIKRINTEWVQHTNFRREFETLCKLQHINVACLRGYCNESSEMVLVYEYISNGSLDRHLCQRRNNEHAPLTWEQRLQICICAARGLNFIHGVNEDGVIHCNVKCSSIMLDEKLVPKISIMGLSILNDGSLRSHVACTVGYIDPEYVSTGRFTKKSDVYSFGVVLLVVLSGIEVWAMKYIEENMIDLIIDPNLRGQIKSESLDQFLKIVMQCLSRQSEHRPTMEEVVSGLELTLGFQLNSTSTDSMVSSIFYDNGSMRHRRTHGPR